MNFSDSPLVTYTALSPNKTSPRNHPIDTLTVHCVEGQCSVEALGAVFADPRRKASSNYGVGADGRIALYVHECDRSWCSSSASNDNRAVTVEVASDTVPPYAVNSAAFLSLLDLLTDICRRNGISKLLWENDPSLVGNPEKQNMTVHRWFADTSCPGDYLLGLYPEIARRVSARLVPPEQGDLVALLPGAVYFGGAPIPSWVSEQNWFVKSVDPSSGRAVIDISENGAHSISSAVDVRFLLVVRKAGAPPDDPDLPSAPQDGPAGPDRATLDVGLEKSPSGLRLTFERAQLRDLFS